MKKLFENVIEKFGVLKNKINVEFLIYIHFIIFIGDHLVFSKIDARVRRNDEERDRSMRTKERSI